VPEGESIQTELNGVSRSITAPWTLPPAPSSGAKHRTELLVVVVLAKYTAIRGANSNFMRDNYSRSNGRGKPASRVRPFLSPACPIYRPYNRVGMQGIRVSPRTPWFHWAFGLFSRPVLTLPAGNKRTLQQPHPTLSG
jgi:hypothetical protein